MRINYRNWAAVQVLDPERCKTFLSTEYDYGHFFCAFNAQENLTEADAKRLEVQTFMEVSTGFFAQIKNLYYISSTFIEALKKSSLTLYKMLGKREECMKVYEDCAFIMEDMLWVVKTQPNDYIRFMRIQKEGALFTSFAFRMVGDNQFMTYDSTTSKEAERGCVAFYFMLMMLKKYGQADIEMLPKNKKVRSRLLNEKSINETGLEVKVLDSRWFTTICRDEGFLVTGHFRLQPKKDENGEWTRELIYINPYAKKGYHRLAPVVNIESTTNQTE